MMRTPLQTGGPSEEVTEVITGMEMIMKLRVKGKHRSCIWGGRKRMLLAERSACAVV
jgi:hypothetical protein